MNNFRRDERNLVVLPVGMDCRKPSQPDPWRVRGFENSLAEAASAQYAASMQQWGDLGRGQMVGNMLGGLMGLKMMAEQTDKVVK